MAGPRRLHLVVAVDKASHLGSALCFRQKKIVEYKSWATVTQSIKIVLGWKFWIQDPLHELEVLPLSLAHLVARKGWAYAKGPKGIDPYPPNHTSSISPNKWHGLRPCLKE